MSETHEGGDAPTGGRLAGDRVAECDVLLGLAARGGEMAEVARSLAIGAVVRGRLQPGVAARLAAFDGEELFAAAPATLSAEAVVPLVSVVVPAFDEEENLPALWERLRPVLDAVGSGELVIVDDGSSDGTWDEIVRLAAADERVHGVRLSRNFGQQAALSAGMAHARGASVCFMDADLQDPPELLTQMVGRWQAGNDVVYAVRRNRKEGPLKRLAYRVFYRVYRRAAQVDVPLDSGDFALLDRRVVDEILALPERNRFLRGLRSWVGFTQVGLEYDRQERHAGDPKYTVRSLVRLAADGLLSFSALPLRAASLLGMLVALAGGIYIAVAVVWRLYFGGVPDGWTSIIALMLSVGGVQLLVIGVLGEYLARVYDETKSRPNYLVARTTRPPEP